MADADAVEETTSAAVAKKAKAKTKTKTKAKPKAKKKTADQILDTASEIENLSKDKIYVLVDDLQSAKGYAEFRLGGALSAIKENGWFLDDGYTTFREMLKDHFAIDPRKADYAMKVYNCLVESGIAYSQVESLGWTKIRELAQVLTLENLEEWIEIASGLSTRQLIEYLKEQNKGALESNEDEALEEAKKTTTKTFKLHADQKETIEAAIVKAKEEAETEYDAVALDAICMNYLNSETSAVESPGLVSLMSNLDFQEVLEAFDQVFPNIDLDVTINEEDDDEDEDE